MASGSHLEILKKGVRTWNRWRRENPTVIPNLEGVRIANVRLRGIDFRGTNLQDALLLRVDLQGALLSEANLERAHLLEVDLRKAKLNKAKMMSSSLMGSDLRRADLHLAQCPLAEFLSANLASADLREACLVDANLSDANLRNADLRLADLDAANLNRARVCKADLRGADLSDASLNQADLRGANLIGCRVYGISVWDVNLDVALQSELIITPVNGNVIQVDNLEVAQFIYLLLNNEKIRDVIDSGFAPDPSTGSIVQIYLDPGTSRDLVVSAESTDTVFNQGTNSVVVGCQQATTMSEAKTGSEAGGSSLAHPRFPIGKHSPYRP